jgi:uncharacterized protein (TIGR02246 family)
MGTSAQDLFQRYTMATMSRDAERVAELFAPDGVLESPLMPEGKQFPRRMEGQAAIRDGLADFYRRSPEPAGRTVNLEKTRFVLHETSVPETFIAEIDTVLDGPDGSSTAPLVQIFRARAGKITLMRDYFAPDVLD